MATITVEVNGQKRVAEIDPRKLLVDFLREHLQLTGTHVGCDTSQCGACTVHVDGKSVKSCTMLAVEADGSAVTTIEGLAASSGRAGELHPMQAAFHACHGLQCGFCTPGMVMSCAALYERKRAQGQLASLSEGEIREAIAGNLCRCGTYPHVVGAMLATKASGKGGGSR